MRRSRTLLTRGRTRKTTLGPAPGVAVGSRVGAPYNLRDCTDMSAEPARQNGVHYGLLTSTACDTYYD